MAAINWTDPYNYGGVNWFATTPSQQQSTYDFWAANGVNPMARDTLDYTNSAFNNWASGNQNWLQSQGYTGAMPGVGAGQGSQDYTPPVNSSTDLENWLKSKGYTFATGQYNGTIGGSVFDQNGGVIGNPMGGSGTGYDWGWTIPVGMFLGGAALAGQLGGGAAAGVGATDAMGGAAGTLGAVDSQAANAALGLGATTGAVPTAVDLGSLGGVMGTGAVGGNLPGLGSTLLGANNPSAYVPGVTTLPEAGTVASGVDAFGPGGIPDVISPPAANNPSAYTPGSNMPEPGTVASGMPPVDPGYSIPGLGDTIGKIGTGIGSTIGDIGKAALSNQGLAALISAWQNSRQSDVWQKQMDELNKNFSPDSVYAKQMADTIARKDAAAGRNSQYGVRAEELAADLTKNKANAVKDLISMQDRSNAASTSQFRDLLSIIGIAGNSGGDSGLSSGFQDLLKLIGGG